MRNRATGTRWRDNRRDYLSGYSRGLARSVRSPDLTAVEFDVRSTLAGVR
jgi:hypothetical protein